MLSVVEPKAAPRSWDDLDAEQQTMVGTLFDPDHYLDSSPELAGEPALLVHYLDAGWRQGRNPTRSFRTMGYLRAHPALWATGQQPLLHYLFEDVGIEALRVAFGGLSSADVASIRALFDTAWYFDRYADVKAHGADAFIHYMTSGWREGRNPAAGFSTDYYLERYPDIARAGMNPFLHWALHGRVERRSTIPFHQKIANREYRPSIAAIVPNFNHARFLAERIDSILAQTYPDIDILILDDCSTDSSRSVIDNYVVRFPDRIRCIYNETNSGGVFQQWRLGVEETSSDLIWICESDDFCEPDFVERLVPQFADGSVQMSFGRILETDVEGKVNLGLDTYRETAEAGIWDRDLVRPAAAWFANGFGVNNLIANVGGCIFRRSVLPSLVWHEAASYRVVGDWYLYIQIAGGGQIAWVRDAVSYFRRHGSNTSSTSFEGKKFYVELERLMIELKKTWDIPAATVNKFYGKMVEQYNWFSLTDKLGPLEKVCHLNTMLATSRQRHHILLVMLGFVPGGGENFPIQLANQLIEHGWIVSMLIFETDDVNEHMRAALNPAVSVYESEWVIEYGCDRFVHDAGITLIHSHTVGGEMHFFDRWRMKSNVPYIVTLHGSYEASSSTDLPPEMVALFAERVNHFVYTADKNLRPLAAHEVPPERLTKMANAMPIDPAPFPKTREELGIADEAIVFTLVARGIERKGWTTAINAFCELRRRHPRRPLHLCLVGEGEVPDRLEEIHGQDREISFLGYQSRIHGLYRLSDVAVVPTRFSGESFPLCIIQSLQVGVPVIASDVGEIGTMLRGHDGTVGGMLVDATEDSEQFTADFTRAMEAVLDNSVRADLAKGAATLGAKYDMRRLVDDYIDIYTNVLRCG